MNTYQNEAIGSLEIHGVLRTNLAHKIFALFFLWFLLIGFNEASAQDQQMMVRISEIQIDANHLESYKSILKEEAEASVRLEPGVIAIFPMYQKASEAEFKILEIYANREAYEAHLKTPHFQKYKASTLHMVKSLKLVDMNTLDAKKMAKMFSKMRVR